MVASRSVRSRGLPLVQGSLRSVIDVYRVGVHPVRRPGDVEYEWTYQERYHHWLGEAEGDCTIQSAAHLPPAVVTTEKIPTGDMVQILEAEDELLRLVLSQANAEILGEDLSGEWALAEISLSGRLDPELGFAYHATFRAPGRFRGPSCTFTITNGAVQVHSVGFWVA